MKLGSSLLGKLALMICGDIPYNKFFPHRSSSYLTKFFEDLNLDYTHDGTTRNQWVRSVLIQLNNKLEDNFPFPIEKDISPLPSKELITVIEYLIHPDHFSGTSFDRNEAIKLLNDILMPRNLKIEIHPNTNLGMLKSTSGYFISTATKQEKVLKVITFAPEVFKIPEVEINKKLVSVMMPFSEEFKKVFKSIKESCINNDLECLRADDIWDESTFIQDIFNLIYNSGIVVVDFTNKNSNVLYETGIAHTLGKLVIPITQSLDDIPSDLKPHRALKYYPNKEGLEELAKELSKRLKTVKGKINV